MRCKRGTAEAEYRMCNKLAEEQVERQILKCAKLAQIPG